MNFQWKIDEPVRYFEAPSLNLFWQCSPSSQWIIFYIGTPIIYSIVRITHTVEVTTIAKRSAKRNHTSRKTTFFQFTTKAGKFRHIGHIEIKVLELNDFGALCDFQLCQEVSALIKKSGQKLKSAKAWCDSENQH